MMIPFNHEFADHPTFGSMPSGEASQRKVSVRCIHCHRRLADETSPRRSDPCMRMKFISHNVSHSDSQTTATPRTAVVLPVIDRQ